MSSYACIYIYIYILDVLLLLQAATLIAPLFWEFQPQSNAAAGTVPVSKTTRLSLTSVLQHKYGTKIIDIMSWWIMSLDMFLLPPHPAPQARVASLGANKANNVVAAKTTQHRLKQLHNTDDTHDTWHTKLKQTQNTNYNSGMLYRTPEISLRWSPHSLFTFQ